MVGVSTPVRSSPRDRTRDAVLALIREGDGVTRSELVATTGLSRSTVNHAVSRLLESGQVAEAGAEAKGRGSGSGRAGLLLRPVASDRRVAGIDIGHAHVAVALADELGVELGSALVELDVDADAGDTIRAACELYEGLAARFGGAESAVAGVPLPIDRRTGAVRASTAITSWASANPASELTTRFGFPVHVENDAVVGAIGELSQGAGRHWRDFLYVKASHGIGAALIIDGEPYRGAVGLAGDIGHNKVPGRSELCRCGDRGCVEAAASLDAVRTQFLHTHPGVEALDPAAVDEVTARILDEAGRVLGRIIAEHCNMLNPEGVIVGGALSRLHPAFMDGVTWSMREVARPTIVGETPVVAAELGTRAQLLGATRLAASRLARP